MNLFHAWLPFGLAACAVLCLGRIVSADDLSGLYPNAVQWNFSAVVRSFASAHGQTTNVPPPHLAELGLVPGAILSGQVTLDLDAPDNDPSGLFGRYAPTVAAKIRVGELVLMHDGMIDLTYIGTTSFQSFEGMSVNFGLGDALGVNATLGLLELGDGTGSVFTSDDIPVTPPGIATLTEFDPTFPAFGTRAGFFLDVPSGILFVNAELVELSAVPEQATAAMAICAISILALRNQRSRLVGDRRSLRLLNALSNLQRFLPYPL